MDNNFLVEIGLPRLFFCDRKTEKGGKKGEKGSVHAWFDRDTGAFRSLQPARAPVPEPEPAQYREVRAHIAGAGDDG